MSTSTIPADRDQQLLAVGHQCSHDTCGLVDFLPFKCQHCSEQFCGDHFLPQQHSCPKYDEFAHNRVAPDCPFCNEPVAIPPGEDANTRMERHFTQECSIMTGKAKSKTPRCARARCEKVLYTPIKCDKCSLSFCPTHRFPATHNCSSIVSSSKPALPKPTARSTTAAPKTSVSTAKVSQASKEAMVSVKESMAAAKASTMAAAKEASSSGPFNKTGRSPSNLFSSTMVATTTLTSTNSQPSNTADANDPPEKCIPKQPAARPPFAPPPLFATA